MKKKVVRAQARVALLRDIANIARLLKECGVPQKRISPFKPGVASADEHMQDIHARIGLMARNVRLGKLDSAACDVGFFEGVGVGYLSALAEKKSEQGGTILTTVF